MHDFGRNPLKRNLYLFSTLSEDLYRSLFALRHIFDAVAPDLFMPSYIF